jgi:hypothetical protein
VSCISSLNLSTPVSSPFLLRVLNTVIGAFASASSVPARLGASRQILKAALIVQLNGLIDRPAQAGKLPGTERINILADLNRAGAA